MGLEENRLTGVIIMTLLTHWPGLAAWEDIRASCEVQGTRGGTRKTERVGTLFQDSGLPVKWLMNYMRSIKLHQMVRELKQSSLLQKEGRQDCWMANSAATQQSGLEILNKRTLFASFLLWKRIIVWSNWLSFVFQKVFEDQEEEKQWTTKNRKRRRKCVDLLLLSERKTNKSGQWAVLWYMCVPHSGKRSSKKSYEINNKSWKNATKWKWPDCSRDWGGIGTYPMPVPHRWILLYSIVSGETRVTVCAWKSDACSLFASDASVASGASLSHDAHPRCRIDWRAFRMAVRFLLWLIPNPEGLKSMDANAVCWYANRFQSQRR